MALHILKASSPITLPDGSTLAAGEWLCNGRTAFYAALMAERGSVEVDFWSTNTRQDYLGDGRVNNPFDPKSTLVISAGFIGDLLLLTPAISALQLKYPSACITLSCSKNRWMAVEALSVKLLEYPVPVSVLSGFDLVVPTENAIELSTEKGQHATDAFAEAMGVTVEDYRPVYRVTEEENLATTQKFPTTIYHGKTKSAPRVALQLHASSVIRNYPLQQWNVVIKALLDRGWEIMLMGNQDGITGGPPALKDCSKLTFREAAAVIATCDVFCGVDSSFFNLCPALGVPAIGLFGPVDWKTRIKDMDRQRALTTPAPCAPCGWTNSRAGRKFPAHGPCAKSGRCEPLAAIPPDRIVAKIDAYRK